MKYFAIRFSVCFDGAKIRNASEKYVSLAEKNVLYKEFYISLSKKVENLTYWPDLHHVECLFDERLDRHRWVLAEELSHRF